MLKPEDSSNKPKGDDPSAFGSLDELDDKLARAADDASTLAAEVGAPETQTAPSKPLVAPSATPIEPASPEQVLAGELARAESQLESAASEIGAADQAPIESNPTAPRRADQVERPAPSASDEQSSDPPDDLLDAAIAASNANTDENPKATSPEQTTEDTPPGCENSAASETAESVNPDEQVPGVDETVTGLAELDEALGDASELDSQNATAPDAGEVEIADAPTAIGDTPHEDATAPPSGPEQPASVEAVPDFMREFMEPEDEETTTGELAAEAPAVEADKPPEAASASHRKFQSPARPGVVGTGMMGVVGNAPATSDEDTPQQESVPEKEKETDPPDESRVPPTGLLPAIGHKLEPVALVALDRVTDVLDRMDRPIRFIGPRLREWIGWAAIATLGTALIVFVAALF